MPVSIDQYANKPIVVITFTDDVKAEALVNAYMDSVEAAGKPVYRVLDFRAANTSYMRIFSHLLALVQGIAGAAIAPTLDAVMVGQPHMAAFFTGHEVAFFEDINDAVAHVRRAQSGGDA